MHIVFFVIRLCDSPLCTSSRALRYGNVVLRFVVILLSFDRSILLATAGSFLDILKTESASYTTCFGHNCRRRTVRTLFWIGVLLGARILD